MNNQNYLIKIQYSLLVQPHWHIAEMFYVENNITILHLKNEKKKKCNEFKGRKKIVLSLIFLCNSQ